MPKPPDVPLSEEEVMRILQQYGTEFHIFEFEDQPNVFAQPEREEPHTLKSGNVNPRALQHWSYLDETRSLLRQRYGLFPTADLLVDCPLKQMQAEQDEQPDQTRKKFFRLYVDKGMIACTCNARTVCPKKACAAKQRNVLDIYDLIAWLDKKGLNHARKVVGEHFGVKLGNFPRTESKETKDAEQEQAELTRYAVSNVKLRNLFRLKPKTSKEGGADAFIQNAVDLICNSPDAPYDGYNAQTKTDVLLSKSFDWKTKLPEMGASARLFVWLHWQQAVLGKKVSITDEGLCKALQVGRTALFGYKKDLKRMGYLKVDKEGASTVKYTPAE